MKTQDELSVFRFVFVVAMLCLVLLMISLLPISGAVVSLAQLVLFFVAGVRVYDLFAGRVQGILAFISAVGGLLVALSLLAGWLPLLGFSLVILELLQAVGLALLVAPLAMPGDVRRDLGGC